MPPKSIFNGTIAFGQVNVPVKVHSATEDRGIHFHEVHAHDGARIEHRRICPKHGEVPYKEVVKGFEVSDGQYVVLTQDEINAAAGPRSRVIELNEFVCAEEIDPVFFDRTYYLGAGRRGTGRTPTGCCTTRCARPGARASGAGSSTTASTWSPCARPAGCCCSTRCTSRGSW